MDLYRSNATQLFLGAAAGEPDGIPIIDTDKDVDLLFPKGMTFGHDPDQYVPTFGAIPDSMTVYQESDWDALYQESEEKKSSLEHLFLRGTWKNLDQNGDGYCWAYSPGHAIMLSRVKMHLPFVRLNPHSVASIIKNGRDEGGWCGLSLAKYREIGIAEEGTGPGQWPLHSRQNSRFNDPTVKESMLQYRVTDDFFDIGKPLYSQQLKRSQLSTCLFNNNPSPVDFNWWGHSVCAIRWVRISAGEWGLLILNSWLGWGRRGLAVLRGPKMVPNGAVAVVATLAA